MGKLTISMAICNSYVSYYQRLTLKKLSKYGDGNQVKQWKTRRANGETWLRYSCLASTIRGPSLTYTPMMGF